MAAMMAVSLCYDLSLKNNSGMNPGGWKKTKNMNISQKRQIYYTVITYKY
jgi:hypothetical protein